MLAPLNAILGGALLVAGRKLFWLFIGVLGFITGIQLTTNFINGPEWLTIIIGLILGWIMLAVLGPIYDIITKMKT